MKRRWMVFYDGKKELAAYTLKGTFVGELEATMALLVGQRSERWPDGIPREAIRVAVETRNTDKNRQEVRLNENGKR